MRNPRGKREDTLRFESANIESIFFTLDAIAWLDLPDVRQIAQFAGIDPRTAGKLLKNCVTIGIVETVTGDKYRIVLPYPYKGSPEQKRAVIREAVVRMPLMVYVRQFLNLGDTLDNAVRKAATMVGVREFDPKATRALLKWASQLDVLRPELLVEDLVEEAFEKKEHRHAEEAETVVAFVSHTSKDKPFVRQLASDLTKAGVSVWLDEQRIMVGDSITQKISQGLANSDFLLIALSGDSVRSEWVKRELSAALLQEVERRKTVVLPIKLSECEIPQLLKDKKYADFSKSYKEGLRDLLAAIKKGVAGP